MILLGDTPPPGLQAGRFCRGCGCTDNHACIDDAGPCGWFVLDVGTPSGVCTRCAAELDCNPVLIDTVGTDAMDDVSASIFAHLACARRWPPRPALQVAA